MECHIYNGLADLPHFSPELDDDKSPAPVLSLREQLRAADGVLICTPEYAFGIPGSLKNALDWPVSSGEFWSKPVAVISASSLATGGNKAHAALLLTLTALGATVSENARLMVGAVNRKLYPDGRILDFKTKQELIRLMEGLAETIKAGETVEPDL